MSSSCTPPGSGQQPGFSARRWWLLAGVLLVLDLVKHGLLLALGQEQPWGDSTVYWRMGTAVANGDVWLTSIRVAYRTPGYPWYLGICQAVCGDYGLWTAILGQHLACVGASVLTAAIVWQLTRSPSLTLLGWALQVLTTARPLYANWLLTEPLATFLLTLTLWCLVRALLTRRWEWLPAGGLALGVGLLVRPSLIAVFPALIVCGVWLGYHAAQVRERWWCVLAGPAVVVLLLLPWSLRNWTLFDRLSPCVFTGRELWTAQFSPWPGGALEIPVADFPILQEMQDRGVNLRHQWTVSHLLTAGGVSDAAADRLMEQVAREAMRRQPFQALFRTGVRCLTFWYCWEWETDTSPAAEQAVAADMYAGQFRWSSAPVRRTLQPVLAWTPERWRMASNLWQLACFACWLRCLWLSRTRQAAVVVGLTLLTATLLTAALEIPLYRYRCPYEPLLIVMVAAACCRPSIPTDPAGKPTRLTG